ncbi:NAD(P)H-dependent oxidoreductase subunit E [Ilumatobacter coccineus]|uniref:Putative formate dehydrogenase beta subunit n=1 Tax=Ilumatobacter coccineus (strain NBRC 103263 / KCTC 29153 / YM16-304) TaxID=1313172 RepID=A0A6C7EFL0_ILUCY|nr:NAD(P)H-dependent oxidoreductase subunit E [Ilumatobacter coccineus]BAN03408.1 putative formate dehydrogenase beta subunit [Ilumatobacter coccineus YM16-304]
MADLKLTVDHSTDAERGAVDAVLTADDHAVVRVTERLVRGGMARRKARRHLLLPGLHALQAEVGWISPGGLNYLCDVLQVPPAEGYGVATFYDMFRTDDPGHTDSVHHVCIDTACHIAGAEQFAQQLEAEGKQVHRGPCLGQCERAPARFVQGRGEPDHVPADTSGQPAAPHRASVRRLLKRVGVVDPTSLASYREHGGYAALARAIDIGPDAMIDEIRAAGLTGRGGAAFPTAIKWRGVADEHGRSKHVIANADESEPGTFKDRVVMENDPFSVIEGLTLAGLTVGAEHGWIYIRGEYPLATRRLRHAIDEARSAGLLGGDVLGSGQAFDIELRRGAGAYICGEETALIESIEGFRGEPRNKPPFPSTHGLFGEPTAVNNPETLLSAMYIAEHGPDTFRLEGTEKSPGTRLFCLSGHVAAPGVYEVAMGTTLGDLIELAGGATGTTRAILMGGAAGTFVGADQLDMPLTHEDTRERGTTLGSGVVTLFDDSVDFMSLVLRIAEFFRGESCGQCVPCRVGVVRQHEVLVELRDSGAALRPERHELVDDIARAMADASICGLGHTAAGAVQSAIRLGLIGGTP